MAVIRKAVILAGGLGTRLAEETSIKPKPMVEVGGMPILWHIMKLYSFYGVTQFVVCLGYKGYVIKEYFNNYFLHNSDVTFDIQNNGITYHSARAEPWEITAVDTGDLTMTGGRLKRIARFVGDEPFHMTYGDGVGNVDIAALEAFHLSHKKEATVTVVQPPGRFGVLDLDGDTVTGFREKPVSEGGLINAGYFVLSPKVLGRIENDKTTWEREPMESLAADRQLVARRHDGFWQPMDTLRDKQQLEDLWQADKAPWRVWS
jgi:glucose-1-phosphate cytidylyltransferase